MEGEGAVRIFVVLSGTTSRSTREHSSIGELWLECWTTFSDGIAVYKAVESEGAVLAFHDAIRNNVLNNKGA